MPRIKPKDGWEVDEVIDLAGLDMSGERRCEDCNHRLRYVHRLSHPDYPRIIDAGCCCAARRVFGYDASGAEDGLRKRAARLRSFINETKWHQSSGNPANVVRDNVKIGKGSLRDTRHKVTIRRVVGGYRAVIHQPSEDHWDNVVGLFESRAEAKVAAFERIEYLKARAAGHLRRRGR